VENSNPEIRQTALAGSAATLLRIFVGSRDRHGGETLFDAIVREARESGLAGATVFEGFMGFGANSVLHHASVWHISQDLPIIIEIVDQPANVAAFLPRLETLLSGAGLVTLETVQVLHYQPHTDVPEERS
jgi:PII-like signaling protein